MNATNMVQGNLALKLETPAEPTFTVVQGGRSGFQPLTVKSARNQQAVVAPARVALKVPTIVAVAVALTLFVVLATSSLALVTPRMPSPFPTLPTRLFAFSLVILFGRLPRNILSKAFPRKRLPT